MMCAEQSFDKKERELHCMLSTMCFILAFTGVTKFFGLQCIEHYLCHAGPVEDGYMLSIEFCFLRFFLGRTLSAEESVGVKTRPSVSFQIANSCPIARLPYFGF
jgi:hypothetical protein